MSKPTLEALALILLAKDPSAPKPLALSAAAASPVLTSALSPPPAIASMDHGSSTMPGALEEAFSMLDWLWGDL